MNRRKLLEANWKPEDDYEFLAFTEESTRFLVSPYFSYGEEGLAAELKPERGCKVHPSKHTGKWRVFLKGVDDFSIEKEFLNKEKAEEELTLLREFQPLSFEKDILKNGYEYL